MGPNDPGLLGSYARAFDSLGCTISYWDPHKSLKAHVRLGRAGEVLTTLVPIDAWLHKANRELVIAAASADADIVCVSGNAPIRAGALAQLRIMLPKVRLVLLWPDPLVNLSRHVLEALPVYDLVATYSRASVPELERLGGKAVRWIPFAGDPFLFPQDIEITPADHLRFDSDVCLIGSHRPERETAILKLVDAGIQVRVWGEPQSWKRHAQHKAMLNRYYQGESLVGTQFAKAIRCAKLSLNPIDPTNFPSANMRFFESPMCGGATLNSPCPEMASVFPDREGAFYFENLENLVGVTRELLADASARLRVSNASRALVLKEHTYVHRAQEVLGILGH